MMKTRLIEIKKELEATQRTLNELTPQSRAEYVYLSKLYRLGKEREELFSVLREEGDFVD